MCTDLQTLIQERAEIEKAYAKSLRAWSKKWGELIEKGLWTNHRLILIFESDYYQLKKKQKKLLKLPFIRQSHSFDFCNDLVYSIHFDLATIL